MWGVLFEEFWRRALLFGIVIATLTPLELYITHERHSLKGRLNGLLYWAIWTACGMTAAPLLKLINPPSLFTLPVTAEWAGAWDIIAAPLLAAMISDGYFYFHHRIQHAVPLFWRFHAVHHSIREMNAVNAYHHPLDDFIRGFISLIPLAVISVDVQRSIPAMALIFAIHPAYLHSPIKTDLGWFRQIFGDNLFHRIHHSTDPAHHGKNFGAFTTIWDRAFGTAYWPAKDEWPEIGLKGIGEPRNVREWVTLPWRYRP